MKIGKTCTFHSAHFLPGHATCGNTHGHSYRLEVVVEGPVQSNGMLMDFALLKLIVKTRVLDILDHTLLNDIPGLEVPTAEHICVWCWRQLADFNHRFPSLGDKLSSVKIWETSTCWAELRREDVETILREVGDT